MIGLMPLLWPAEPSFAKHTERKVWEALRDQLGDNDLLISNLRLSDRQRDWDCPAPSIANGALTSSTLDLTAAPSAPRP